MIELHPNFLERNGKKAFAVLPVEEFESLVEALADYEDLQELRKAKDQEQAQPGTPLPDVRRQLGI